MIGATTPELSCRILILRVSSSPARAVSSIPARRPLTESYAGVEPGFCQPVSVSKNITASLVIDLLGSSAAVGVAPSVELTRPIVTLEASETAAVGSATG